MDRTIFAEFSWSKFWRLSDSLLKNAVIWIIKYPDVYSIGNKSFWTINMFFSPKHWSNKLSAHVQIELPFKVLILGILSFIAPITTFIK